MVLAVPKVTILITTFKDPPLLVDILESLKMTDYPNFDVLVVDCLSNKVKETLESEVLRVPLHCVALRENKGAAHHLNFGMQLALKESNAKYISRIEGDAVPVSSDWLKRLVKVMEDNPDVAIAMPFDVTDGNLGYGGRLFGNCTFSKISTPPNEEFYPCIGTGGHCFIVRKTYLLELFEEGIQPYWEPFYISSEDIDFNLKAWLRSYKVVVGSTEVRHRGTTGPARTAYRVYHMYKNRLCLLLLNFGLKHIVVNVWYRVLHDIASAVLYSEPVSMLKAYLWVFAHLREIFRERALRMARWKRSSDKELKRHVLVKLPMPIRSSYERRIGDK